VEQIQVSFKILRAKQPYLFEQFASSRIITLQDFPIRFPRLVVA